MIKKITKTFLLFFLLMGCRNNDIKNLENDLENEASQLNIEIEVKKIEESVDESLSIELSFITLVSNYDHQNVFLSYLIQQVSGLDNFKTIEVTYYLNSEDWNKETIRFSSTDINLLSKKYKENKNLEKMVKYTLENFNEIDPYYFENSLELINKKFPKKGKYNNVFSLINVFYDKSLNELNDYGKIEMSDPTFIFFNIYKLNQIGKSTEHKRLVNHVSKLWEINYGNSIENTVKVDDKSNFVYLKL